jgi:cob(I)alamin adenosyltransferase
MKKDVRSAMVVDILSVNMSIYTKTGDKGTTSLYGGKRVSKSDLQVDCYGTVDELTSLIGLVASKIKNKKDRESLIDIQKDFYKIMSFLSGMEIKLDFLDQRVKVFEKKIDQLDKKLPRLHQFIIPGGTEVSSWFHMLRTVCRRSERKIVCLHSTRYTLHVIQYLNRLSDLFFTLARFYNKGKEVVV